MVAVNLFLSLLAICVIGLPFYCMGIHVAHRNRSLERRNRIFRERKRAAEKGILLDFKNRRIN